MKKFLCVLLVFEIFAAALAASCAAPKKQPADTTTEPPPPQEETTKEEPPPKTEPEATQPGAEKTPKPALIGSTFLAKDRYIIAGTAPEHAIITIQGALSPVETRVIDGLFVAEVFLERQNTEDVALYVYAKSAGKETSDPTVIAIDKDDKRDTKPVYVGKKNHLHYEYTLDDYLGINLFSEKELSDMRRGAQKLQKQLQDAGLKTELVIFIAPNHATIYPETMPDFLAEKKVGQDSRAKQMLEAFEGSGIKVIFPYEALLREKGDNLLYFLADTHWNELGAYFGYFELFGYIGEKFPDAAPLPQSELDIYETTMYGGDIISNMLFFDSYSYTSTTTAARIKSPKAAQTELVGDPGTGYQVWKNESKPDLPTIAMYRDSFSVAMLGFMAESSGKLVVNSMWDFDIDMAQLKELNPDYLIIEKVERETRSFSVLFR